MSNCVNKSSEEFKDLLEESGKNKYILAADIDIWQKKNGIDVFPTMEQLYEKNTIYDKTDVSEQDYYVEQLRSFEERTGIKPSKKLKSVVEKLLSLRQKVKLTTGHIYINTETGETLKSVTDVLGADDYYKFDGEDVYDDNREWGSQIDRILENVLLGKDIDETKSDLKRSIKQRNPEGTDVSISNDVIEELYEKFQEFKEKHKDSVIITQQVLYNEEKGVAGTADIIIIDQNGKCKIVDLKSSINPTNYEEGRFKTYEKESVGEDGQVRTFKNAYDRKFKNKSSRKEKHEAQLSAYKGLGISKGLEFAEEESLVVLPVYIKEIDGSKVVEVKMENEIPLSSNKEFIEELWDDGMYKEKSELVSDERYDDYVKEIKTLLQDRLAILKRRHSGVNKFEKAQIERLKKVIDSVENTEVLNKFVNQIFDLFVENQKTGYPGIVSRIEKTISKIEKGDISGIDAIGELQYYKETINLYGGIISDLSDFYNTELLDFKEVEAGTTLWKLKKINDATKRIENRHKKQINPLIAKELSKFISTSANESLLKDLEGKKERLAKYIENKSSEKVINNLKKQIKEIETKFKGGVTYNSILKELNEGSDSDLSLIDAWVNPAISSSNSTVALFAKMVKSLFEEVRMNSFAFSKIASREFETYKKSNSSSQDNVTEFNKGIYERIKTREKNNETGEYEWEERLAFVQKIDITKYQEALDEAYKEKRRISEEKGVEAGKLYMREWYFKNTELSQDFSINGVIITKGANTLVEEQQELLAQGVIQEWEFENWLSKNRRVDKTTGEEIFMRKFSQPKESIYMNKNYVDLLKDSSKLKYYNFLVSQYMNDQDKIPHESRMGYLLPSITKGTNERVRQNGFISYFKYSAKNAIEALPEDVDIYGEDVSSKIKIVPLLFHNRMPVDDISVDLIASVMQFHEATLKYEAQTSLIGISDSTLEAVSETTPYQTDSLGKRIINASAKKAGIEGYQKYLKKYNGNNIAAMLDGFIDMQIYGKKSKETKVSVFGKEIDLGKAVNSFMGASAFLQIGGNPLLSAANYFTASANASIEATGNQFFSQGEYQRARLIYDKHVVNGDFIKDFASPINKTLIGQLVDLYDPMQGSYTDKYGRKISHSTARKLISTDTWFFMQQQGEHNIQVRTMIAMLLKNKVTLNGKEIPLLEAYEIDESSEDKSIKLKDGVVISGNVSANGLVNNDTKNSLHAINRQMHGVYDGFNRTMIEREWWGRLVMMYRKFVVPGFKRRYKQYGFDQEMGIMTEGYYKTFFRLAITETKELLNNLMPFTDSNLTDIERANSRRAMMEMAYMLTTGIIIMILSSMSGGDDDKDKKRQYALFFALRLNNELGFFLAPGDVARNPLLLGVNPLNMYKTFRAPTAGFTLVEKTIRLATQLSDPFEEYKRDSGPWKKGDNKLMVKFLKLIGASGSTLNPDQAVKILMMQTN